MQRKGRRQRPNDLISATYVAAFVYCREAWRLEHGLGLAARNDAARNAGVSHHRRKTIAERIASGSMMLGRVLIVLGVILVILLVWWRR